MNPEYPPLALIDPIQSRRRRETPRIVPTPPEVIARRAAIAQRLREQVAPLARRLRGLTEPEKRAVFYKLEHDGPIDARKLGLKPLAEPTDHFTIAIPRDDLTGFESNIDRFAQGDVAHGMVPKAQIAKITAFAEGTPLDRLSQDLFDNYEALTRRELLIIELELLSIAIGATQRREELLAMRTELQRLIAPEGTIFEHEEMKGSCRAVIRCTGAAFKQLVESSEWQRAIVWFEPRPEFQTFHQIVRNFDINELGAFASPPADAPTVCVVDTGVSSGNPFLRPVTRGELVRSFLKSRPDGSDEYGHGSGVASLVAYYALNIAPGGTNSGQVWIASARVLDENNQSEERLFSAALKEVVEFFAPRGIKVFNLSVNVRNRRWDTDARRTMPRRSWIARRIDHLSREHDVVFVISTGNIDRLELRAHYRDGSSYPRYLALTDSSLLDPGQAALALTVGSVALEATVVGPAVGALAIAEQGQPSPFTRCGPGIAREIKPEVVDYGGNLTWDGELARENYGCSVPVATHQLTPALTYSTGTSLAAPRVAHKLALVSRDLQSLGINATAALLRAFIVNSARHPLTTDEVDAFATAMTDEPRKWLHALGYGVPDSDRATGCDPFSVVLFHQGTLQPDTIAFLEIPVPASLQASGTGSKRLTVTVAQSPEVQQWGLEQYLGTVLKWRMFRGDVSRDDVVTAMSRSEEEEVEPRELPQELAFGIKVTQRSRGTVQHDVYEWKQHREEFSEHNYTLAIAAFSRWSRNTQPVPYAAVVRLEETTRTAPIYAEVRNALVELRVRVRS